MVTQPGDLWDIFIDQAVADGGGGKGRVFFEPFRGKTTLEAFAALLTHDDMEAHEWAVWALQHYGATLDGSLRELLFQKVAKDSPREAAALYIETEDLSVSEERILLRSFHSKHNPSRKTFLPQIEAELADGRITPAKPDPIIKPDRVRR